MVLQVGADIGCIAVGVLVNDDHSVVAAFEKCSNLGGVYVIGTAPLVRKSRVRVNEEVGTRTQYAGIGLE